MTEDSTQSSKLTPGPWKIWHPASYGSIYVVGDKNLAICRIMTDSSADADARLIAAAPEMLAALKDAFQAMYGCRWDKPVQRFPFRAEACENVRAAIAEAEGGSDDRR